MRYALLNLSSPADGQCLVTAARVANGLVRRGHQIDTVFFSDAATAVGLVSLSMPQDELCVQSEWQRIAAEHQIDLVLCVASALQRGVVGPDSPGDAVNQASLAEGFRIGGLGELVRATHTADRVLTFGG